MVDIGARQNLSTKTKQVEASRKEMMFALLCFEIAVDQAAVSARDAKCPETGQKTERIRHTSQSCLDKGFAETFEQMTK